MKPKQLLLGVLLSLLILQTAARLEFTPKVIDFGEVRSCVRTSRIVEIKNAYSEIVVIKDVESSSVHLVSRFGKDIRLLPNETAHGSIWFYPAVGNFSATLYASVALARNSTTWLESAPIRAFADQTKAGLNYQVQPIIKSLVLKHGKVEHSDKISIYNPHLKNRLEIRDVISSSTFLQVQIMKTRVPARTKQDIIRISFSATRPMNIKEEITFKAAIQTGASEEEEIEFTVPLQYDILYEEREKSTGLLDFGILTFPDALSFLDMRWSPTNELLQVEELVINCTDPRASVEHFEKHIVQPYVVGQLLGRVKFAATHANSTNQLGEVTGSIIVRTNSTEKPETIRGFKAFVAFGAPIRVQINTTYFYVTSTNTMSMDVLVANMFKFPQQILRVTIDDKQVRQTPAATMKVLPADGTFVSIPLTLRHKGELDSPSYIRQATMTIVTNITSTRLPLHIFTGKIFYLPFDRNSAIRSSCPKIMADNHNSTWLHAKDKEDAISKFANKYEFILWNPNPTPIPLKLSEGEWQVLCVTPPHSHEKLDLKKLPARTKALVKLSLTKPSEQVYEFTNEVTDETLSISLKTPRKHHVGI